VLTSLGGSTARWTLILLAACRIAAAMAALDFFGSSGCVCLRRLSWEEGEEEGEINFWRLIIPCKYWRKESGEPRASSQDQTDPLPYLPPLRFRLTNRVFFLFQQEEGPPSVALIGYTDTLPETAKSSSPAHTYGPTCLCSTQEIWNCANLILF
jgi:hypothetical protein